MSPAILNVQNLGFQQNERVLISQISFQAQFGQALGIVGPNGAGKSTLLRCLSAFLKPNLGQIDVLGQDLFKLPDRQRACLIASVSPRENLPPFALSVYQYLAFGRAPHQSWLGGWQNSDQEARDAAIQTCSLEPWLERSLTTLSSGEWQRVQLARALTQEPRLLLLDEPTSHLDIGAQIELMTVIRQWLSPERAVLVVVHDLNLAAQFMDQILILKAGESHAFGEVNEVLTPEVLKSVYDLDWHRHRFAEHDRPLVFPAYQSPAS